MTSAAARSSTGEVASAADLQRCEDTLDLLANSAKACPSAGSGSHRSVRTDPAAIGPARPQAASIDEAHPPHSLHSAFERDLPASLRGLRRMGAKVGHSRHGNVDLEAAQRPVTRTGSAIPLNRLLPSDQGIGSHL